MQTALQMPKRTYESRSSVHSRNAFKIMEPAFAQTTDQPLNPRPTLLEGLAMPAAAAFDCLGMADGKPARQGTPLCCTRLS